MRYKSNGLYYSTVKFVKETFSDNGKISIIRCDLPKDIDGDCEKIRKHFKIRIHKDLPEYYAIDVLLHEIAHVLSWDTDDDFHGLNWGKAYSKVYRKYLDWFDAKYVH